MNEKHSELVMGIFHQDNARLHIYLEIRQKFSHLDLNVLTPFWIIYSNLYRIVLMKIATKKEKCQFPGTLQKAH